MGEPRVAVIVVGWNCAAHVERLLGSLPGGVRPLSPTLCVVDNGSDDGTAALFEEGCGRLPFEAFVHRSPSNLGFTGGGNLAFRLLEERGGFDFYVLLNPDAAVEPGWLPALLEAFADPEVGAASSALRLPDGRVGGLGCGIHVLGFGFPLGFGAATPGGVSGPLTYASGAALALSRPALARVQALSGDPAIFWEELFLYHDDLDLGWRLLLAGSKPALARESRVVHFHAFEGSPANPRKFFFMERNRFLVLLSCYRWATLALLAPAILLAEVALALASRGPMRVSRSAVYRDVWRHLRRPAFWARRRRIQRGRVRGDRDILTVLHGRIDHPETLGLSRVSARLGAVGLEILRRGVWW